MSNEMTKAGNRRVTVLASCLIVASVLTAQSPDQDKRLLFLTHAGLYKHASLGPAERAVIEWGAAAGFEVTGLQGYMQESSDLDLSVITADYLAQFNGLMMFTNGNLPLDEAQRQAITDFVRGGGGFIGVHSASLTLFDYPEYGEMLGGYFRRPVRQNHLFVLEVEDSSHPATRMLGPSWPLVDELYLFGNEAWRAENPDENRDELFDNPIPLAFSRDRVRVLLSIDTAHSDLQGLEEIGIEAGGDYPQAWCRNYGQGRSFYTTLGHREDIWTNDPVFRAHVTGGIRWALGLEPGDARPLGERREPSEKHLSSSCPGASCLVRWLVPGASSGGSYIMHFSIFHLGCGFRHSAKSCILHPISCSIITPSIITPFQHGPCA